MSWKYKLSNIPQVKIVNKMLLGHSHENLEDTSNSFRFLTHKAAM